MRGGPVAVFGEVAGECADAAFVEGGEDVRLDFAPMDDGGHGPCVFSRETDDLLVDEIQIMDDRRGGGMFVGAVWKFVIGVPREL